MPQTSRAHSPLPFLSGTRLGFRPVRVDDPELPQLRRDRPLLPGLRKALAALGHLCDPIAERANLVAAAD